MKKTLLLAVVACACVSASAWAQPPADCKPNALNIPNAPYPCIFPDGRVMFRVNAPDAQKVSVRIGRGLDMTKEADGLWYVTITAAGRRLPLLHDLDRRRRRVRPGHPHVLRLRLRQQRHRDAGARLRRTTRHKDVPRGQVRQRWYFSKVTGAWRRAYVYTPPDYDTNTKARYPVLYLHARLGRERAGLAHPGPRRRDHGQPDRREEGQAVHHRDGQPERREAGRERRALRGPRHADAGRAAAARRRRAPAPPRRRQAPPAPAAPAGARGATPPAPAAPAPAAWARSAARCSPR